MDARLIEAVRLMMEGGQEGFNTVYAETHNHVYFRALGHTKNEADAQDLTQIVYEEVWKSASTLHEPGALFGWLDRITYNQGVKMFRKYEKETLLSEEGQGVFDVLENNDISTMPEPSADEKETANIIRGFIDELPPEQRSAVIAYYFDGFNYGEIAGMQECPEGTVKSRMNYARKFLNEKILEKEKREGIRLHSLTPPAIWYALWRMSKETTLSAKAAERIYQSSCNAAGLVPTTLSTAVVFTDAGAGMARVMPAWDPGLLFGGAGSVVAGASAGSSAVGGGVSAGASTSSATAAGGATGAAAATAATGAGTKTIAGILAAVVIAGAAGTAAIVPRLRSNDNEALVGGPSTSSGTAEDDSGTAEGDASADALTDGEEELTMEELAARDVEAGTVDTARYEEDNAYRLAVNDARYAKVKDTYLAALDAVKDVDIQSYDGSDLPGRFPGIDTDNVMEYAYWKDDIFVADMALRYSYVDVDGNGTDEMLIDLWWEYQEQEFGTDYLPTGGVKELFTFAEDQVVRLDNLWDGDTCDYNRAIYVTEAGDVLTNSRETLPEDNENRKILRFDEAGDGVSLVYHDIGTLDMNTPGYELDYRTVVNTEGMTTAEVNAMFDYAALNDADRWLEGKAWVRFDEVGQAPSPSATPTPLPEGEASGYSFEAEEEWQKAYIAELDRILASLPADNSSDEYHANAINSYIIYDIDKDGIPEMILDRGSYEAARHGEIYRFSGDSVTLISGDVSMFHASLYSYPGGNGILTHWAQMGHAEVHRLTLQGNTLSDTTLFTEDGIQDSSSYTETSAVVGGAKALPACDPGSDMGVLAYRAVMEELEGNSVQPAAASFPAGDEKVFDDLIDNGQLIPVPDGWLKGFNGTIRFNELLRQDAIYYYMQGDLAVASYKDVDVNRDGILERVLLLRENGKTYNEYAAILSVQNDGVYVYYFGGYINIADVHEDGTFELRDDYDESYVSYRRVFFKGNKIIVFSVEKSGGRLFEQ